jgi:hypothetical protein
MEESKRKSVKQKETKNHSRIRVKGNQIFWEERK